MKTSMVCSRLITTALFSILIMLSAVWISPVVAEEGKLSGYMFGDYYWVANNHDAELKNLNGFRFRRIYFTYDRKLGEGWDVRFRPEFKSSGDFSSKAKITAILKDGYVRYTRGSHQIIFGLSPTPTWGVIEKIWGYRSVEPTPLDLYKYGSSRDFGLALKGKLGHRGRVLYHCMLANGAGTSAETDAGKKVMLALAFVPVKFLTLEVYGDYEGRPDDRNRRSLQGFIGGDWDAFHTGLQYTRQIRQQGTLPDLELDIVSLFGRARFHNKVWGLVRFDRQFDPNPDGAEISYLPIDPRAAANYFLCGLDIAPHPEVNIIPNVEIVKYDEHNGITPDTDVLPRLTMFYRF